MSTLVRYFRCFSNGQPTTIHVDNSNFQIYADMVGDKGIEFHYGSVSIPIESISNFKIYTKLPSEELERYFFNLVSKVHIVLTDNQNFICDVCKIQKEILTNYWGRWIKKGYVKETDILPLALRVMGFEEQTKTKGWFS